MRTIKFRARRKNGKWVVGNFINHFSTYFKTEERHSIFLPKPENDNGGYWVEDIDPETVGQFTSLHDCDGKEITKEEYEQKGGEWHEGYTQAELFNLKKI